MTIIQLLSQAEEFTDEMQVPVYDPANRQPRKISGAQWRAVLEAGVSEAAAQGIADVQAAAVEAAIPVGQQVAIAQAAAASVGYLYPGSFAVEPTTRPDGSPRQVGDRYFNSTSNLDFRWNGSTWASSDINTANLAASGGSALVGHQPSGTGSVARTLQDKGRDTANARDFGVRPGTGNDYTTEMQRAIDAMATEIDRVIDLPAGVINCGDLHVSIRNVRLRGAFQSRGGGGPKGTQLTYIGNSGSLIQMGVDNGNLWSAADYDGPEGLMLENLNLMCDSPNRTTPLALAGNYAAGCYGIRDWRGGDVKLRNVTIEGFEYNFWGVNSDFNTFEGITSLYSKYGIYAGPKSDQFTINDLYSFNCDHVVTVDGAAGVWINRPKFVICGSTTEAPVLIRRGSGLVVIRDPWYENFSGITDQLAMVQAGTEDGYNANTNFTTGTVIENPIIGGGTAPAASCKYLVVLGNARNVVIDNPVAGNGLSLTTNLTALAAFAAGIDHSTSNSSLRVRATGNYSAAKLYTNLGTGTANVFFEQNESGIQVWSASGRLLVNRFGGTTGAEALRISTENTPGQVVMATPTYTGGQTQRITIRKAWADNTARPSSGTYEVGDFVRNTAPVVLGAAASQYVIFGWMRMTDGSTHVLNTDWVECRTLTGT